MPLNSSLPCISLFYSCSIVLFSISRKQAVPALKKASLKDVLDLLRHPGFGLWMGVIFLFGLAEASLINFLFLHVRDIGGIAS